MADRYQKGRGAATGRSDRQLKRNAIAHSIVFGGAVETVMEADMRTHRRAISLFMAAIVLTPGAALLAQDRGSIPTETQQRQTQRIDEDLTWNLLGLLGLAGVIGLRRGHPEDSYHPAGFE